MKTSKEQERQVTIAVRIPPALRQYFEHRASIERRRLSDVLRHALEDHAAFLQLAETKPKHAAKAEPTGLHSLI